MGDAGGVPFQTLCDHAISAFPLKLSRISAPEALQITFPVSLVEQALPNARHESEFESSVIEPLN
jgi:hypothetical protein